MSRARGALDAAPVERRARRGLTSVGVGYLTAGKVMAVVLALAAIVGLWAGRGIVFIGDEWGWINSAVHVTPNTIVADYYGHLFALTHGAYVVLPESVGLAHYWIFRGLAVILHLTVALLVYLIARGSVGAWPAVGLAALVAFLGTGADAFIGASNIGLLAATAAGLGALLTLARRSLRGDLATCGLLVIGLLSFTTAVAFTAGVFVEVLWQRDRWRRIWVPLVPTLLYVAWRLHWGGGLTGDVGGGGHQQVDLLDLLKNSLKAATGAIAGLGGVQLENPTLRSHLPWLASILLVVVAVGAGLLAFQVVRARRLPARLANVVVTGLGIWLLIALGRGSRGDLYASRYVYAGAVVAVLIVVYAVSAYGLQRPRLGPLAAGAVITCIALNIMWMIVLSNHVRDESTTVRAGLAALDIARSQVPASFRPGEQFAFRHITAGSYFSAVRKYDSSPAYTAAQLRHASDRARQAADGVLLRALNLRLVPERLPERGPPPTIEHVSDGRVLRRGSCLSLTPQHAMAVADLVPRSPSGVVFEHGRGVRPTVDARRFGDRYLGLPADVRGGDEQVATPLGRASETWHLRIIVTRPMLACSLVPPRSAVTGSAAR